LRLRPNIWRADQITVECVFRAKAQEGKGFREFRASMGLLKRLSRSLHACRASPYADIEFRKDHQRDPQIRMDLWLFQLSRLSTLPADWSQVLATCLAQKYCRKAGVPARLKSVERIPPLPPLAPCTDEAEMAGLERGQRVVGETSATQVFDVWLEPGPIGAWKGAIRRRRGRPDYYDRCRFAGAPEMGAPNSPQWFNTGLAWAYGIDGPRRATISRFQTGKAGRLGIRPMSIPRPQPLLNPVGIPTTPRE